MKSGSLGKVYSDGEAIIRQGEVGHCMYVIQEGQVEVLLENDGRQIRVRTLGQEDFFGEMAIFEGEVRSATVRALGNVRALTLDKRNFLRAIHDEPSLAFRIVKTMSERIRGLNAEILRRSTSDRRQSFRVPLSLPVWLSANGTKARGTILDLSDHGCLVETGLGLTPGQSVGLQFPKVHGEVDAEVRRRTDPGYYGLRFEMSGDYRRHVAEAVGVA